MDHNSLQVFDNGQFSVRSVYENGEIWFVAKDIATALEYSEESNPSRLMQSVPEIWKGVKRFHTPGGEQDMLCLTEQGVYFFLGRSDKPKAQPYQIWIAGEVVPSIRKTGSYSVKHAKCTPKDAVEGAKVLFELAGITGNQLVLAADKVYKRCTGFSALLAGDIQLEAPVKQQALTPSQIAEQLGLGSGKKGAKTVNKTLEFFGYQHKVAGKWEPLPKGLEYAVVLDTGKSHSDGTPIRQIKWNSDIIHVLKELVPF